MSYFNAYRDELEGRVAQTGARTNLRNCQLGAYWGVQSHFTTYNDTPAIISIPTGGGKTALMMLLAFGLEANRALIVAPSNFVRNQTAKKFRNLEGLRKAGIVDDGVPMPTVETIDYQVTNAKTWDSLADADVIVALPHNISEVYESDIVAPPDGYFDVVCFDEAHHATAPSWRQLLNEFGAAKQILLTATPFRRDRQRLPGKLVYHYPLEQAMDDGIYETVRFERFHPDTPGDANAELAAHAEVQLRELTLQLRESDADVNRVQALIRSNTIDNSKTLKSVYDNNTELEVKRVDSDIDSEDNEETLGELERGEIDGIIAVGKLGEGFDHDNLKLGVFHYPPRSFPYTLQFIGRMTRPIDEAPIPATVLANPRKMKDEGVGETVRDLYRESEAWANLLPDFVFEFVEDYGPSQRPDRVVGGAKKDDLRPYLSTTIYTLENAELDPPEGGLDIGILDACYRVDSRTDQYVAWITERFEQPAWASKTSLGAPTYDLHVFYPRNGLLFECTSSSYVASKLRSEILEGIAGLPSYTEMASIMDKDDVSDFITAGLRSGQDGANALPEYKMYLGSSVEWAVNPTDTDTFHYGHAFGRLPDANPFDRTGDTLGVGLENRSVWSSGRASLDDLIYWCRTIAFRMNPDDAGEKIGRLRLRYPKNADEFSSQPLLATPDPELYRIRTEVADKRDEDARAPLEEYWDWTPLDEPAFDVSNYDDALPASVGLNFQPCPGCPPIPVQYTVADNAWTGELTEYTFELIRSDGDSHTELSGREFLQEYPPQIHLAEGEVVRDGASFKTTIGRARIPWLVFETDTDIDWSGCDRTVEFGDDTSAGQETVHEWMERHLNEAGSTDQIIFRDHSSGEIADYIVIDTAAEVISFYHCKSGVTKDSGGVNIGATLDHIRGVLDQVLRTLRWIGTPDVFNHIEDRHRPEDTEPDFVQGEEQFYSMNEEFDVGLYSFEVVAVLPTLQYDEARRVENVNAPLLTCYEWLENVNADFRIIGTQEAPN